MLRFRNVILFALVTSACTHARSTTTDARDLAQNITWKECTRVASAPGGLATLIVRVPPFTKFDDSAQVAFRLYDTAGKTIRVFDHIAKNEITISETVRRVNVAVLRGNRPEGQLMVDLAVNCTSYAYFTLAATPALHRLF